MKILFRIIEGVLWLAVFARAVKYYEPTLQEQVPLWMDMAIVVGVVGVTVLVAVGHVVGGGLMGLSAGGVLNGMKLGLLLGLSMGIGRLWPYLFAIAMASGLFNAPWYHWHTWIFLAMTVIALGLNLIVKYMWRHVT